MNRAMNSKTQTRSDLKRAAIISAAKEAFKQYGVQSTSMDKLAELAKVSKRTVYNHFASKEELVMFIVTDLWQQALVNETFDYQKEICIKKQLLTWINVQISLISSKEFLDLSRVAISHLFFNLERLQQEMERMINQSTNLQKWLQAAIEDNQLKINDIEYASFQMHSLIEGSCFWPQLTGCKPLLTDKEKLIVAKETCQMFLARYQVS